MTAAIATHQVAQWILGTIKGLLDSIGLEHSPFVEEIIYVAVVVAASFLLGRIITFVMVTIAHKIIAMRKTVTGMQLIEHKVLSKCSRVIPPFLILALVPFAFEPGSAILHYINKFVGIYLALMFGLGGSAIINFIWHNYDRKANKDNHPLKGIANVVKGIMWGIIVIVIISILFNKSPLSLLAGLGAFSAVLMLIFKDAILGFVAGFQLSSNDMLRVGDWIVVPSTPANGIVTDVTLSAVKVQNWDNTIVSIPPYTLVSSSFQNWRGMSASGVRQIDRSVIIDNSSIAVATPQLLSELAERYPSMKSYIADRQAQISHGESNVWNGGTAPVNGTIDTNLGLFRAYMCQYLLEHPKISNDNNIIVRLMESDSYGTPLDIYCFTSTTDWLAYEAIRSQIFEHIAATAPIFGLRLCNLTAIVSSRQ